MLKRVPVVFLKLWVSLLVMSLTTWALGFVVGIIHWNLSIATGSPEIVALRVPLQVLNVFIGAYAGYRWGWRNKMFIGK